MRFAIRFTQLRLQSFGAAVAQLGRKDSPFRPLAFWQAVVGHLAQLHEASLLEVNCSTGHITAWQLTNLVFPVVYLGQRRLCLDVILDYRLNSFFRMLRMLLRSGAYLSAAVGKSSGRKQGEPETLK